MGLDIYFSVANRKEVENTKEQINALQEELHEEYKKQNIDGEKVTKIRQKIDAIDPWKDAAYFRKVNFLLPFFHYTDNCSDVEIKKNQVVALVDACEKVLADHSLAEELLPTSSGFFFGGTQFDDWYFDDVRQVRNAFKRLLRDFHPRKNIYIMHCWW